MRTAARESVPQRILRLFQRRSGGASIYDFDEGGCQCDQALILRKVFASHEELLSPRRDLVLF